MVVKLKSGKLNCIGGYSYVIVLPKVWIDNHLLAKGDSISFVMDDEKNLILKPLGKNEANDKT